MKQGQNKSEDIFKDTLFAHKFCPKYDRFRQFLSIFFHFQNF